MSTPSKDPIKTFQDAGIPVDTLPEEYRNVLANLSEQEVNTLLDIQRRVEGASEVEGYRGCTVTGGILF